MKKRIYEASDSPLTELRKKMWLEVLALNIEWVDAQEGDFEKHQNFSLEQQSLLIFYQLLSKRFHMHLYLIFTIFHISSKHVLLFPLSYLNTKLT